MMGFRVVLINNGEDIWVISLFTLLRGLLRGQDKIEAVGWQWKCLSKSPAHSSFVVCRFLRFVGVLSTLRCVFTICSFTLRFGVNGPTCMPKTCIIHQLMIISAKLNVQMRSLHAMFVSIIHVGIFLTHLCQKFLPKLFKQSYIFACKYYYIIFVQNSTYCSFDIRSSLGELCCVKFQIFFILLPSVDARVQNLKHGEFSLLNKSFK